MFDCPGGTFHPLEKVIAVRSVFYRTFIRQSNAFRTETQRLASLYQQKLLALEALKKSLLHQAFSGAL